MLRHGILRQRFVDMLTDTFRAALLRLMGYEADVVEFVSSEHTPRNLLIRAVRMRHAARQAGQERELLQQYDGLKALWGVTPFLEGPLALELQAVRDRCL